MDMRRSVAEYRRIWYELGGANQLARAVTRCYDEVTCPSRWRQIAARSRQG